MNYISSGQAAEMWGISKTRVTVLANGGRIPGAKLVGARWMIPSTAKKPADGRTRGGKALKADEVLNAQAPMFRYPIFDHKALSSFDPPLCSEEMQIRNALEAVYACRFEEAERALGKLAEETRDRYRRLIALRILCTTSIFLNRQQRFLYCYGALTKELAESYPRKIEMRELIHEIDATLGESSYFSLGFHIEPGYAYHESFLPHLASLCAISLFYSAKKPPPEALRMAELNCAIFDRTDNYADIQSMHLYLGCIYALLNMNEDAARHLRIALELAQRYELYYAITMICYYMKDAFDDVLAYFPEEFREKLTYLTNDVHQRYVRFTDAMEINNVFRLMLDNDFIYVLYAAQGLTYEQTAKLMNVSVSKINRKYASIFDAQGVKNKKELISYYKRTVAELVLNNSADT